MALNFWMSPSGETTKDRGFPSVDFYQVTFPVKGRTGQADGRPMEPEAPGQPAIRRDNETEAFGPEEPFHGALGHRDIPCMDTTRRMRRPGKAEDRKLRR